MRGESTREWMFTLLEASTFGKFIDVMQVKGHPNHWLCVCVPVFVHCVCVCVTLLLPPQIVLSLGLVALAISLAWDGPFHGQVAHIHTHT